MGLPNTYVAWANGNQLQLGAASLIYQLILGRPKLMLELIYTQQGIKADIGAIIWYGGMCSTA